MTVQEAHKEYNSLTDHIRAKYEQLDLAQYRAVSTPAFNAEACELANLFARVSQLCQKLNMPPVALSGQQTLVELHASRM